MIRSRKKLPLAGVLLLSAALVSPAVTHAEPAPASDESSRAPVAASLRIGTYNIPLTANAATFNSGIAAVQPLADIIGLQEVAPRSKIDNVPTTFAWAKYFPEPNYIEPILYRRDRFDLLTSPTDLSYLKMSDQATLEGLNGKPPEFQRPTYASVARLRDRVTGQALTIINAHLINGAVNVGLPRREYPIRLRIYKQQMKNLARITKAEESLNPGRTFVLGDFNANFVADKKHHKSGLPYKSFKKIGFKSNWDGLKKMPKKGSQVGGFIDQIWTKSARPTKVKIYHNVKKWSDHNPVVATYAMSANTSWTPPVSRYWFNDPYSNWLPEPDTLLPDADGYAYQGMVVPVGSDINRGTFTVVPVGGTAVPGVDYKLVYDLQSDSDPTTNGVRVMVLPDDLYEPDETIELELVGVSDAAVDPARSRVKLVIEENDYQYRHR